MTKEIEVTVSERGVARLRLTRGDKHNALTPQMMDAMSAAAAQLGLDETVRIVILEAEGKSFCAGGDLGWMRAQMAADRATRRTEARRLAHMLRDLNNLPKPLVARVHGNAFGGGVGLCAVSDVVIASAGVRFGLTETRLGLIPATIGPYVLARIGQGAARRFFASSEQFGAQRAEQMGLVSEVASDDRPGSASHDGLDSALDRVVAAYLNGAPGAIAAAKGLALTDAPSDAAVEASIDALMTQWESGEADEGTAAFFEKRPPVWSGA